MFKLWLFKIQHTNTTSRAGLSTSSINCIITIYLPHVKFVIEHLCLKLNDQDIYTCIYKMYIYIVFLQQQKNVYEFI